MGWHFFLVIKCTIVYCSMEFGGIGLHFPATGAEGEIFLSLNDRTWEFLIKWIGSRLHKAVMVGVLHTMPS